MPGAGCLAPPPWSPISGSAACRSPPITVSQSLLPAIPAAVVVLHETVRWRRWVAHLRWFLGVMV
ncbi:MAG: hypothetical protein R3D05_08960 [Dongiaceae bacterium]